MHVRSRNFLLLVASLLVPAGLMAQGKTARDTSGRREIEVAVTYAGQYSNLVSTPTFWQSGGSGEVSAQIYHHWGVAAKITGTQTASAANSGNGLTMITANFGPRYTYSLPIGAERKRTLTIFGEGLVGPAWGFNSYFPTSSGIQANHVSFALQVGGGVDIGLSRHFGIRAFQADWLRTEFPNGATNVQNNLRLAAGIVFNL